MAISGSFQPYAGVGGRGIEAVYLVLHLGVLGERTEPMGKTGRHEELTEVIGRQLESAPLPEGGRRGAQVDNDIVDGAPGCAKQLALSVGRQLEVHAAQHPFGNGERMVVLDKGHADTALCKGLDGIAFDEEPPRIAVDIGFNKKNALQVGWDEVHRLCSKGFGSSAISRR